MTLILNSITHRWAFSVSDRLLTQRQSNGYKEFDPISNKAILLFTSDAMVSICYTGTAYIGNISTDRWVAEKLTGYDLSEGKDYRYTEEKLKIKKLYFTIEDLITELNAVWPSLSEKQKVLDIGLTICGWVRAKKKPLWRPVLWYLGGNGTSDSPFRVIRYPKFFPMRQVASVCTGVPLEKQQIASLGNVIRKERKSGSELTTEKAIVEHLITISDSVSTVGKDCIAIRMSWSVKPQVIVTYYSNPNLSEPLPPKKAAIDGRAGMIIGYGNPKDFTNKPPNIETMKPYYSPWLISGNTIIPPSSNIGTLNYNIGNLTVVINGSSPPKGIIGGFVSQKRPPKP